MHVSLDICGKECIINISSPVFGENLYGGTVKWQSIRKISKKSYWLIRAVLIRPSSFPGSKKITTTARSSPFPPMWDRAPSLTVLRKRLRKPALPSCISRI